MLCMVRLFEQCGRTADVYNTLSQMLCPQCQCPVCVWLYCVCVCPVCVLSPQSSPECPPLLCAPAGLHDHVGHVFLHDAVLRVEVHHGEGRALDGHAARRHGRVDAVGLQLAEHGGVEGRGEPGGARVQLRTLTHAVLHVLALRSDAPV